MRIPRDMASSYGVTGVVCVRDPAAKYIRVQVRLNREGRRVKAGAAWMQSPLVRASRFRRAALFRWRPSGDLGSGRLGTLSAAKKARADPHSSLGDAAR